MEVLLLSYNNYYNRIVKYENNIDEYYRYATQEVVQNVNLKPNDGVDIELPLPIDASNGIPDYAVVFDLYSRTIDSRWFILEATRNRQGQYMCKLRRDVLVDYFKEAFGSQAYIEKGFVTQNNPLIFNRESRLFNQIKQKEIKLWDDTKSAWVVGYMDSKIAEDKTIKGSFKINTVPKLSTFPMQNLIRNESGDITLGTKKINGPLEDSRTNIKFNISSFEQVTNTFAGFYEKFKGYYSEVSQSLSNPNKFSFGEIDKYIGQKFIPETSYWTSDFYESAITQINFLNGSKPSEKNIVDVKNAYKGLDFYQAKRAIREQFAQFTNEELEEYQKQGKLYVDEKTGKYYSIKLEKTGNVIDKTSFIGAFNKDNRPISKYEYIKNDIIYNQLNSIVSNFTKENQFNDGAFKPGEDANGVSRIYIMSMFAIDTFQDEYSIAVEEVIKPGDPFTTTIKPSVNDLNDAPYKMFCFPYDGKIKIGADSLQMSGNDSLSLATALYRELQTNIYDIQLLPYCPIQNWFASSDETNALKPSHNVVNVDYTLVTSENTSKPIGAIFWPQNSRFTFNIPLEINTKHSNDYDFKVARETELYRIMSPNFSNFQEFDPYMNDGVNLINVDCTYKPITPYIKLNINYKYLYGADFDDDRGLILGGDFSLPLLSNEWKQYEIANKNYSNIFDRQQENIAKHHRIGMASTLATIPSGAIGAATGGFKQGGTAGALAAGSSSFINSAIGTVASQANYNEDKRFRKDMYEFNLQNIQARPQGLVRTSAFNYNNKMVPFIEFFNSTQIEKDTLKNKLVYNGMLLETIGKPIDYVDAKEISFIKANIIRYNGLAEDSHIANVISDELNTGVYFKLKEDKNFEE